MSKKSQKEMIDPVTGEVFPGLSSDMHDLSPGRDLSPGTAVPRYRSAYINKPVRQVLYFDHSKKRTKDEFKDDCDVNKIWANFVRTGRLDQLNKAKGFYADLTGVPQSYHESLNLVVRTREMFDALPSDIRNVFGNDVQAFMHAAHSNPDELFKLLEPVQPIDGSAAIPVPATPPEAPEEPSVPSPEPKK